MRHLLLLRHATASPASDREDAARPLSDKGRAEAFKLGEYLRDTFAAPEKVYCSPALRTRQTLEEITRTLEGLCAEYVEDLYYGTVGDYLSLIQKTSPDTASLLVIGHNPNIHSLAASLAAEDQDSAALYGDLSLRYRPGTLTVLKISGAWQDIQPGTYPIAALYHPEV